VTNYTGEIAKDQVKEKILECDADDVSVIQIGDESEF